MKALVLLFLSFVYTLVIHMLLQSIVLIYLFLFVCGFTSLSRIFKSYGDVTITGEGLKMLVSSHLTQTFECLQVNSFGEMEWCTGEEQRTFAQHSWSVSNEGSLTCHTYCHSSNPFIMVISEDPWHSHLLLNVWQLSCHYMSLRL